MENEDGPRFGIVGAGALGSYFGIRLAAAGNSVNFLLRSDFDQVQANGMELTLVDGKKKVLESPSIYQSVEAMGAMDLVIIGLKTTRNYLYKELLPPLVGEKTILITVQNGLGNVEALEELFPANPIIGALCQIGVCREAPGQIRSFVPRDGFVLIGGNEQTESQLTEVLALFTSAGINTRKTPSLGEALWRKLMWNVPFNGLTVAIGGKPTDAICKDPQLRAQARELIEEIRLAGNALGYPIEPEYTDKLLGFTDKLGPYMASSVHDWLAGRRLEVDSIFRKPLDAGTSAGVPMPQLAELTSKLSKMGEGRTPSA